MQTAAKAQTEAHPIAPSAPAKKPPAAEPIAAIDAVHPEQESAAKTPSRSLSGVFRRRARPAAGTSIETDTPPPAPMRLSQPQAAKVACANHSSPTIEAVAAPEAHAPELLPAAPEMIGDSPIPQDEAPPRRRPSFLKRLFGKSLPEMADAALSDPQPDHAARAVSPPQIGLAPEAGPAVQAEAPPKLMDKLSSLEDTEHETDGKGDAEHEEEPAAALFETGEDDDADDPGPLTLSILELQAKINPKAPQIRSFPWLRE